MEGEPSWQINVHQLMQLDDGTYTMGDLLEGVELVLTPAEVKELTLGFSEDLGGVYCADDDFFLDPLGFMGIYEDVMPARVKEFVSQYL
jgi:hypothetical protein